MSATDWTIWCTYAAYKSHLAQPGVSRATARCYLFYVAGFYRLRAQTSQDADFLDDYMRVRAIGCRAAAL